MQKIFLICVFVVSLTFAALLVVTEYLGDGGFPVLSFEFFYEVAAGFFVCSTAILTVFEKKISNMPQAHTYVNVITGILFLFYIQCETYTLLIQNQGVNVSLGVFLFIAFFTSARLWLEQK